MPTDNLLFLEVAIKARAVSKAVRVATWREQKPLERERLWQLLRRMPLIKWPICTLVAAILVPLGYVFPVLQAGYLVLGALAMFDLIRIGRWLEKTSPGTEEMLDLPTPGGQYTVRIFLSHQGTTYGEDSGVISVMEGGLHFSGKRTDFSLTRLNSRLRKSQGVPPVFVVDFWVDGFAGYLGIVPLANKHLGRADFGGLLAALEIWSLAPLGADWKNSVAPPITAQPEMARRFFAPALVLTIFALGLIVSSAAGILVSASRHLDIRSDEGPFFFCLVVGWVCLAMVPRLFISYRLVKSMQGRSADQ